MDRNEALGRIANRVADAPLDLTDAELGGADLTGATMPDGSIHE